MRSRFKRFICATFLLLSTWTGSSFGAIPTHFEDFSTTNFKDGANTTSDWNIATGELKLYPFAPSLAGSYVSPGGGNDVFVAGNYAYLADGTFGLQVIDISDPATPALVGNYDTAGDAQDVYVDGNRAYVAGAGAGLQIIDVTDPTLPVLLGSLNTSGTTYDVCVVGDIAYIADWASGLRIVDISNPTAPVIVGTYDTPGNCMGVDVSGNYAYVADNGQDLQVIDISDPTAPVLATSFAFGGFLRDLTVSGDWLYCAAGGAGLQVINVRFPTAPILMGSLSTTDYAQDIQVSGKHVYIADRNGGLEVIDVSDPSMPVLELSYSSSGNAKGIWVGGEYAFLAANAPGLEIVQVRNLADPEFAGSYAGQFANGVFVEGGYAYIGNSITGGDLTVIDISDPANPTGVSVVDIPGSIADVHVDGNYAYTAAANSGLQVIDISNPFMPTIAGSYATPGFAQDVWVAGDLAFLCEGSRLLVMDISEPTTPTLLGSETLFTGGFTRDVFVTGDYAFVAETNGLHVIDISVPTNPTSVGYAPTPGWGWTVFVAGDHAFVADYDEGLQIFNISDPASPTLVGTYKTPERAEDVVVVGDQAFVTGSTGLSVLDISDPTSPTFISHYGSPGSFIGNALVVDGDYAFVSGNALGLQLVQLFQNDMNVSENIGQSLAIASGENIVRGRLGATQLGNVSWELSSNNGNSWEVVPADNSWVGFGSPGSDLVWRSTLGFARTVNTVVDDVTIDWLTNSALIASVNDIPNDQGKQVSVEWTRSGHDFVGDPSQIVEYAIYRKIDPTLSKLTPTTATTAETFDALSPALRMNVTMQTSAGWHFVGTVPVRTEDDYAVVVPTLADSTITSGAYLSTFMVSALTATPGVFFDSPPDSGYSVDNLAPSVPANFAIGYYTGNGNTLSWDVSPDADFQYFRVYRSTDPNFTPTPSDLVHSTTSLGWVDPDNNGSKVSYRITATDFSGNESGVATAGSVTAAPGASPRGRWALHGNLPNPFNPSTQILYSVPAGGGQMSLRIYDARGQLVKTLVSGHAVAGDHRALWNGRDERGRTVASGMYFYRLKAGDYVQTSKMALTK